MTGMPWLRNSEMLEEAVECHERAEKYLGYTGKLYDVAGRLDDWDQGALEAMGRERGGSTNGR
jgi:hypothetical protein